MNTSKISSIVILFFVLFACTKKNDLQEENMLNEKLVISVIDKTISEEEVKFSLVNVNKLINLNNSDISLVLEKNLYKVYLEEDFNAVEQELKEIIHRDSMNLYANIMLAMMKYDSFEFEEAALIANRINKIDPRSAIGYYFLGLSSTSADSNSIKLFERAIEYQPDFISPYFQIGMRQFLTYKSDESYKSYEKAYKNIKYAIEKSPHNPHYGFGLWWFYEYTQDYCGQLVAVTDLLNKAIPKDSVKYLIYRSQIYEKVNKFREAESDMLDFARIDTGGSGNYHLAVFYYRNKKYDLALNVMKKMIEEGYDRKDFLKNIDIDFPDIKNKREFMELLEE